MIDEFQKFIVVSAFGEGLSLAHHLQMEGKEVMSVMVDDLADIGEKKPEDPAGNRSRWSQFNGVFDKISYEKALKSMEKMEDKEDWFVIFDFNTMWKYADQALDMGFINGLFPSQLDCQLEADRNFAKRAVVKNYKGVRVAEVEELKLVDDGIQFITESDEFWALKGNDAGAETVVPNAKSIENTRAELIDALQKNRQSYESKGFILERQIRDGLESCPQMVYYDGKRVASCVDLEDKSFSASDGSEKYGCALNVIQSTPMDCMLNDIAFPEFCDKLARKHTGLFYIDFNNIQKDGEYFYLEYCSGRMGFDAVFAEIEMNGSVAGYFNDLAHGVSPYKNTYGVGARGFAMKRDEDGAVQEGITINFDQEIASHLWLFAAEQGNGRFSNTKGAWGDSNHGTDLAAFTASSDDYEYACEKLYNYIGDFSFNGLYVRKDMCCLDERVESIQKFTQPAEVASGQK